MSKKTTRKALFGSVMALVLCVALLVGSTFAWFTDEVDSGVSNIQAGKLDVELYTDNGEVTNQTKLFDGLLWEPGMVAYENLTVKNVGNLAVKFDLSLNVDTENYVVLANGDTTEYCLSKILKIGIVEDGVDSASRDALISSGIKWEPLADWKVEAMPLMAESEKTYGVVIYWQPTAEDNNWNVNNGKTTTDGDHLYINLGANLFATQYTYENDSFDNQYDANAPYPVAIVNNLGEQTISATKGIGGAVEQYSLPFTLQFLPPETYEQAQESDYKYWHADYVVKADKDVPDGSVALVGYYDAWCQHNNDNWVAMINEGTDIPAGTEIRLVKELGTTVNYRDICQFGNDGIGFLCSAVDLTGENVGTTITVELRMYEVPAQGECAKGGGCTHPYLECEINAEDYKVIGTYSYTFGAFRVNNSEELEDAIENGVTDIYLATAGKYIMPDVAKGKTLNISGTKDTVIAHQNEGEDGMDYALEGSTVTFSGVTIETTSGTYRGFCRSKEITYNSCYFEGSYTLGAGIHTFNNCHFNLKNNYVWTWGGEEVTFNGCIFEDENGVAKAILVHNTVDTKVTVNNCTFIATTGAKTWDGIPVAAISIDPNGAHTAEVYFEGTNTVSDAFDGMYQNKYTEDKELVTVYVDATAVDVPTMK